MDGPAITPDRMVFFRDASLAVIGKSIKSPILPQISQRCDDLERRSRRILSHRRTVQKTAVCLIIYKLFPVCCDRIRIKVRLADHRKDFSRRWLQYYNSTSPVTQRIIGCCLKICIQGGNHCISHILGTHKFVFDLGQKEFMRTQQLEICLRLQTAFAIGIISDNMCKNIGIRIRTFFRSVIADIRLCEYFTV